jgi:hypothetical protein
MNDAASRARVVQARTERDGAATTKRPAVKRAFNGVASGLG